MKAFDGTDIEDRPSFIKIDVEGAEYRVLRGMIRSLRAWEPKPTLLVEVGWGANRPAWAEELAIFRQLERLGYQATDLEFNPLDVSALSRTTDVLFLPR